jgi:ribonucleoside-diphosphate reductase alpha chain
MKVIKRNGSHEDVDFNKITNRLKKLVCEIESYQNIQSAIEPILIAQKVCNSIYDGVTTKELDELSAEIAVSMATEHPDYGTLAGYISVSNLHKSTIGNFEILTNNLFKQGTINEEYFKNVQNNLNIIMNSINYQKDYEFDYFGIKTLMKSYLIKIHDTIVERPQDMWMRVAISIHGNDIDKIIETYNYLSDMYFTHATPTLFNAGSTRQQLSSCYLLEIDDDSISGIYKTLSDCAQISKWAGGIGLHIHKLRATGSEIRNNKNACTGIVPAMRVFNATAKYVDQLRKRNGSIAMYLSVEHPDIIKFLQLRKNHGDEEERCRDLFYGIWVSDLFMKRVKNNEKWSLFCPHQVKSTISTLTNGKCDSLQDIYGDEYETVYKELENLKKYNEQIDAQTVWFNICSAQIETGTPYLLYKDAVNKKTNQKNLGTIKSSNLCTEILEYTSPEEIAVCNLASIALPRFIKDNIFDFNELHKVTKIVTRNLNNVIDINFYPVPEARVSNMRHRPIGIGVQGLADAYMKMRYPFDSKEASELNKNIFETMYHASLEASMELAKEHGPYETFEGSPASLGILQFDMWEKIKHDNRHDWTRLKQEIIHHGLRNSLLMAPMPTASTSQILGNNECIEPYTSNIYVRRTMAGEFVVINKHLIHDLIEMELWSSSLKDKIIFQHGSVQNIPEIPIELQDLYKTAWELKQKVLIDQAADRGQYICQSQSLNLFVPKPNNNILSSMHFYAWEKGLKTGMYYLRTKPASNPIQFTLKPNMQQQCESCSA